MMEASKREERQERYRDVETDRHSETARQRHKVKG